MSSIGPAITPTFKSPTSPRRVAQIVDTVARSAATALTPLLQTTIADLEDELFKLADQAPTTSLQSEYLMALRDVRGCKVKFVTDFLTTLADSLGKTPAPSATNGASAWRSDQTLSLVGNIAMDETVLLNDIATRGSKHANIGLRQLGQRFAVLIASPALDVEQVPYGPHALCKVLREVAGRMPLSAETRQHLYRSFDRKLMAQHAPLVDLINTTMEEHGVLRNLRQSWLRMKPQGSPQAANDRRPVPNKQAAEQPADAPAQRENRPSPRPGSGFGASPGSGFGASSGFGTSPGSDSGSGSGFAFPDGPVELPGSALDADTAAADPIDSAIDLTFDTLRQLLVNRRESQRAPGTAMPPAARVTVSREQLLGALPDFAADDARPLAMNVAQIQQDTLARLRHQHGQSTNLASEDSDTFELLDLLYGNIEGEIRPRSAAATLLKQLQVPTIKLALRDRAFFARPDHPGRLLINAAAEAGARWLDEDDVDPDVIAALNEAVRQVVETHQRDTDAFSKANDAYQARARNSARKAKLAERRQIEAARGKEKLEIARRLALATITDAVGKTPLPKDAASLIQQVWLDALTLTLLRHGETSPEWADKLATTRHIVARLQSRDTSAPDAALADTVRSSLSQIGYHADDAAVVAQRLAGKIPSAEGPSPAAAQPEASPVAHTRLAQEVPREATPELAPRTAEEDARYHFLRRLPFGTWMEFTINQQGDTVRRRLAWFSSVTDNALFVNQRGQRHGELSLDSLARLMVKGQARVVDMTRPRLIDRAWDATLSALRNISGRSATAGDPA